MADPKELTMEQLRERIRAAGVTIPEHRLAMVLKLLGSALAPLQALDSRVIKTVEPAVRFSAEGQASHEWRDRVCHHRRGARTLSQAGCVGRRCDAGASRALRAAWS